MKQEVADSAQLPATATTVAAVVKLSGQAQHVITKNERLQEKRAFWKRMSKAVAHPITLRGITAIFAACAGAWLTHYYQEQTWIREKQFEVFRQNYTEATELVDQLSEVAGRRLFGLNRVMWAVSGSGTGRLEEVWNDYYETVTEWNTKLARYKSRIARLLGTNIAERFASNKDIALSLVDGEPVSLHGQFLITHERVRSAADCIRDNCPSPGREARIRQANVALNNLAVAAERFLDLCTDQIRAGTGTK